MSIKVNNGNSLTMGQRQSVVVNPDEEELVIVSGASRRTSDAIGVPNVDSSNLSSFLKLNKSSARILRSLSLEECSIARDGDEQRKLSEPLDNTRCPRGKKFSFSATPRKLSLISEQGDQAIVDLGNAIRCGSIQFVRQVIENNGCEMLNKCEVQFETYFRRSPEVYAHDEKEKEPPSEWKNGKFKPQDSLRLNRQRLKIKDRMYVTPFQLAIMSQQVEIVVILLQSVKDEQMMKKLLATTTKVIFKRGLPDSYFKDDRTMDGINAFHLAARFHAPSLHCIINYIKDKRWLDSMRDLLEARDPHMQKTPLHNSTKSFSPLSVTALLGCGANLEAVDFRGYTALHMASKEGNDAICKILLDNGADPNVFGLPRYYKTPMHRARTKKVVQTLLKYGADPFLVQNDDSPCHPKHTVFDVMIQRNPHAVEEIMDNAISTNGQELDSSELEIIFDFELFFRQGLARKTNEEEYLTEDLNDNNEMRAHSQIVQLTCQELLKHPLAEAFLHLKWKLTRKMFYFNVMAYSFFVLMFSILTIIMSKMNLCDKNYPVHLNCSTEYNKWDTSNFGVVIEAFLTHGNSDAQDLARAFLAFYILSLIGLAFLIGREALQAITNWKSYIMSKENLLEILIIFTTLLSLVGLFLWRDAAIHLAAWAVFLAWFELTMMLGRVPKIGIFIYMAINVLKTLSLFFLVYMPLLWAFALTFHILLPSNETFTDPLTALLKVLSMMSGEFDLTDNFLMNQSLEDNAQWSTQLMFVGFLVMGNIVIGNLLIGLTVSKTEEMFKKAGIFRLEKTVHQVFYSTQRFL